MFSFQYPDPKTNFPYYHSDDPEEFLEKSSEIVVQDFYPQKKQIFAEYDEEEEEDVDTEDNNDIIPTYSTSQMDREFLNKHLTKEAIISKFQELQQNISDPQPQEKISDETIEEKKTWNWQRDDQNHTSTLVDIMQEQQQKMDIKIEPVVYHDDDNSSQHSKSTKSMNENARLCIYGKTCKNKKICGRAHTLEEWTPHMCKFNKKCKNSKCLYYHQGDDKKKYLATIIECNKEIMAFYSKSKNKLMYIKNYGL